MSTSPRFALVTGANKGIGLEIARQLAQAGVRVLLGARDHDRGSAAVRGLSAEGLDVALLQLDTTDAGSIAAAAATVTAEHGRLDVLVNNAGIVDPDDGPPSTASLTAVRRTLETNFLGPLALTQALLPLLRNAPAARIVNLASALGSLTVNGDPTSPFYAARAIGYNTSKAALNMLTVQLAAELAGTGILVTSVSPGFVRTDLNGGAGMLTPEQAAAAPVRWALQEDDVPSGQFVNAQGTLPW